MSRCQYQRKTSECEVLATYHANKSPLYTHALCTCLFLELKLCSSFMLPPELPLVLHFHD